MKVLLSSLPVLITVGKFACRLRDPAYLMTMTWFGFATTLFGSTTGGLAISKRFISTPPGISQSFRRSMCQKLRNWRVSSIHSSYSPSICGGFWRKRTSRLSPPSKKKQDRSVIDSPILKIFCGQVFSKRPPPILHSWRGLVNFFSREFLPSTTWKSTVSLMLWITAPCLVCRTIVNSVYWEGCLLHPMRMRMVCTLSLTMIT